MKTLVIIGGSFNPITNAHLEMGKVVRNKLPLADIVYVPSNINYIKHWKQVNYGDNFSSKKREELLRVALLKENFLLDMRESNGELSGRTYDLVMDYKQKGYDEIFFCVGGDKVPEIPKWYKSNELLKEAKIILFERGGVELDLTHSFYKDKFDKIIKMNISNEFLEISSTKVREAFYNNKLEDVKYMIPTSTYELLQRRCYK